MVFRVLQETNTRRTLARRVEENDVNNEIPPQVEQVEQVIEGAKGSRDSKVLIVEGGNHILVFPEND